MYSFIGLGGIIWDQEENFSKLIDWGSHRGAYHQNTWTGCFITNLFEKIVNHSKMLNVIAKSPHHKCFTGFYIRLWIREDEIYIST